MIDKKLLVKEKEAELSHALAEQFRIKEKERLALEAIEKKREDTNKTYIIDRQGNKMDNCINSTNSIDYTNTCFHNALIVKHDSDTSGMTNRSKLTKSAFETAEEFRSNIEKSRIDKLDQTVRDRHRAQERGKEALEKLHTKPFEPHQK